MHKETQHHQQGFDGTWSCLFVGKASVRAQTTRDGKLACGHCLAFVTNGEGKPVTWTVADQLLWRRAVESGGA